MADHSHPWIQPTKHTWSSGDGQEFSPVIVPGMGSEIQPFMMPTDVEELRQKLSSETLRIDLARFMVKHVYVERLGPMFKQLKMPKDQQASEIAFLAINYYTGMERASEATDWPSGSSPPELYQLAYQEMQAEIDEKDRSGG